MNLAAAFMLVGLSAALSCLFVRLFGITVDLGMVPQVCLRLANCEFDIALSQQFAKN